MLTLSLSACVGIGDMTGDGGELPEGSEPADLTVEYVYELARDAGYTGTLEEFILEFKGETGAAGKDGQNGADGVGISGAAFDDNNHLILTLTNGQTVDCGELKTSSTISIGENGNWYINGQDSGKKAEAVDGNSWITGAGIPISTRGKNGDLYFNTGNGDVYKKNNGAWALIANIAGDNLIVNEGDDYNVTINADAKEGRYAAAKALMSTVIVESQFSVSNSLVPNYSSGAGVIYKLDKEAGDAYIITNFHVVYSTKAETENMIADAINLYLYGMEYADYKIPAEYVGGSMTYDIAVLKVTGNSVLKNSAAVAAEVANSEEVFVLDTAIAIGNPASSGISATLGSISVKSQYLEMFAPDNQTVVEYRVMRIDTPVNSGNSGGGLFDSSGRLIGIVNAKENNISLENMGYAIPSNLAVYVADNIIRNCDGNQNESVIKCQIGMLIAISNINTEYDSAQGTVKVTETCVVSEIDADSVANSVLMVEDVLKSFEIDGKVYKINHNYDDEEALLNATPTSEIYVNVERGGAPLRFKLNITQDNFIVVP